MTDDPLDDLDLALIGMLREDARVSNRAIAQALGVAESTAHARRRSLEARGIVTGYTAVVSQVALGHSLQALIGVTLRGGTRQDAIARFAATTRGLPQVVQAFFVGGVDDFVVHVAVGDSSALREFVVDHVSSHATVATTRTSVIFDYSSNGAVAPFG